MKDFLEIGKIVNTHGLKGEVKIMPWCSYPEFICEFDTLYLDEGKNTLEVINARVNKNMVIASFDGIDSPELAQGLRNKVLYMNRNDVQLEDGCYFFQDLIGMEVYDADNNNLYGTIDDIIETGANDVYSIKCGEKNYLIPAIPDVVIETDLENGKMLIRPLKGLFDDEN